MVIFPFVMESNLFVIIYNPKLHSAFFFPSGTFHAQGGDIHPVKIYGFPVKFSKMASDVTTGKDSDVKNKKNS